jgi:hypothetical protein
MLLKLLLALAGAIHAPHSSIVVVRQGAATILNNGRVNDLSLLPLGSISKTLATDVLVQQSGGQLSKIPPDLLRLATHTSGLPRNGELSKFTLDGQAHTPAYSNIGYQLLGQKLGQKLGNYPKLLSQYVTTPLEMADTTATPSPAQCARLVPGVPCESAPQLASTASVYSTPTDMVKYMFHVLKQGPTIAHQPRVPRSQFPEVKDFDHAGRAEAIGLGWVILEQPTKIVQKTGGYQGWFTYIAFHFESQSAVFLAVPGDDLKAMHPIYAEANKLLAQLAQKPIRHLPHRPE